MRKIAAADPIMIPATGVLREPETEPSDQNTITAIKSIALVVAMAQKVRNPFIQRKVRFSGQMS